MMPGLKGRTSYSLIPYQTLTIVLTCHDRSPLYRGKQTLSSEV